MGAQLAWRKSPGDDELGDDEPEGDGLGDDGLGDDELGGARNWRPDDGGG